MQPTLSVEPPEWYQSDRWWCVGAVCCPQVFIASMPFLRTLLSGADGSVTVPRGSQLVAIPAALRTNKLPRAGWNASIGGPKLSILATCHAKFSRAEGKQMGLPASRISRAFVPPASFFPRFSRYACGPAVMISCKHSRLTPRSTSCGLHADCIPVEVRCIITRPLDESRDRTRAPVPRHVAALCACGPGIVCKCGRHLERWRALPFSASSPAAERMQTRPNL